MTKEEQIEYILSKGWSLNPECKNHYIDEEEKFARGGLDAELAYKEQIQSECLEKNGFYYVFRVLQPLGFNSGIMIRKVFKDKSSEMVYIADDNNKNRKTLREIVEKLNLNQSINDYLPLEKINSKNYCLSLETKHFTYHYFVPTYEKFLKTCVEIVKNNNENKCYYFEDEKGIEKEKPELSREQIEKLKDGQIKRAALDEWKSYEYNLSSFKEDLKQKKLLNKALKGDGIAACELLDLRKNYEYEKIECVRMQEVD